MADNKYLIEVFRERGYIISPYFMHDKSNYICFIKEAKIPTKLIKKSKMCKEKTIHQEFLVEIKHNKIVDFDLENGFITSYNDIKAIKKLFRNFYKDVKYFTKVLGHAYM